MIPGKCWIFCRQWAATGSDWGRGLERRPGAVATRNDSLIDDVSFAVRNRGVPLIRGRGEASGLLAQSQPLRSTHAPDAQAVRPALTWFTSSS
jgi:hypothetical protein